MITLAASDGPDEGLTAAVSAFVEEVHAWAGADFYREIVECVAAGRLRRRRCRVLIGVFWLIVAVGFLVRGWVFQAAVAMTFRDAVSAV